MSETEGIRPVRRLTEEGIAVLRNCLVGLRRGERDEATMQALVSDVQYTEPIESGETLDGNRLFENQRDMIQYFVETLGNEFIDGHRKDRGFWSWIALFYSHQMLKEAKKPGTDSCWIYEPDNYREFRRHYFAGSIYLYRDFEKCCEEAKEILFSGKLTAFGAMRDAITYNQEMARIPAVMEVVGWLYYSQNSARKIKPGSAIQDKPGTIRDLIRVIAQFAKTRDFYAIEDAVELWDLLPEQFDRFKSELAH
ncbi:MAG: hypothetical protein J6Y19_05155 [Kiritimatiellae bacterium]|nr:hypothetical protein [Kiritimatiellia bacterium]